MTEKEKMLAGELYNAADDEIQNDHRTTMAWLVRYNACLGYRAEERRQLMLERFALVGTRRHVQAGWNSVVLSQ
jgi:maltose O-acetyltransferase